MDPLLAPYAAQSASSVHVPYLFPITLPEFSIGPLLSRSLAFSHYLHLRSSSKTTQTSWIPATNADVILSHEPSVTNRTNLQGVILMILVAVFGAVDAIIVRLLSPEIHPFVMGFTRVLFGCLAFLPFILARPGILRSNYALLHVVRALLKLCALVALFFGYASAPLADVTAIAFTAPIFVTLGAWVLLAERPQALRVIAVLIGIAGVVIVLRPGQTSDIPVGLLFAFVGAFLTAVIQLMLKPMTLKDKPSTLVAWNLILSIPIAAVPAALYWTPPDPAAWGLLILQGILGGLSMGCATRAFSLSEASLLVPFEYLRLPIVAGLAFLVFGQVVPLSTWLGGFAICGAAVLMAISSRHRN